MPGLPTAAPDIRFVSRKGRAMQIIAATPPPRRARSLGVTAATVGLSLLAAVTTAEVLGWPFLVTPLQGLLSERLDRKLSMVPDPSAAPQAPAVLRFVGGLRLQTPRLEVAAPAWSSAPHLLLAHDVQLRLRYVDLWRAWRGQPLRVEQLMATRLDAHLERLADGRVSWQFARKPTQADGATPPLALPYFGQLRVAAGTVRLVDAPLALDADITLSLLDQDATPLVPTAKLLASGVVSVSPVGAKPSAGDSGGASVLQAQGRGSYRLKPLKFNLHAAGVMPWASDEANGLSLPLRLQASIGRAALTFDGSAQDVLGLRGLSGQFQLSGPSLAAVGDPLGVTLPTTAAFRANGNLVRQGKVWQVNFDDAHVGASRLNGAFSYDTGRARPLLTGRLGGSRLLLADLGPVVGTTAAATQAPAAIPVPAPESTATPAAVPAPVLVTLPASTRGPGMVLPDRDFDLAALRSMDANVQIDLREVDLNTALLKPLRPLRTHLVLEGGVLKLLDLDARAAQGQLRGELQLDGRGAEALWTASLQWDEVRLEHWLQRPGAGGKPAYVTGKLKGRASLTGQGRSTAKILGSLSGDVRTDLQGGAISHLAIEAAGLDLAESFGLLIKGDAMLALHCAMADLVADRGVLRPRVMVLDTSDSTIWVDGSLSLATEVIALRAVVSPKDFSPLTLRSPWRVSGSFAHPEVSVDKGPMARKLGAAFLLALVNPLAALLPLIDPGEAKSADQGVSGCRALLARRKAAMAASTQPGR